MNIKQAVIYARFSPRRNADECHSCENQIDIARKHCEIHGIEVFSVHQDDALSGKNMNRPGLHDAIRDATNGKHVLVVYSLSRLARSTKDAIEIVEQLDKAGADLLSLSEDINTTSAMGRAFFRIIAVLAELERELIAERTSDAMKTHQKRGRAMGSVPPIGYRIEGGNLIEDEYEQLAIERILALNKEGTRTLRGICKEMQAIMPNKRTKGGVWHHQTIRKLIDKGGHL